MNKNFNFCNTSATINTCFLFIKKSYVLTLHQWRLILKVYFEMFQKTFVNFDKVLG